MKKRFMFAYCLGSSRLFFLGPCVPLVIAIAASWNPKTIKIVKSYLSQRIHVHVKSQPKYTCS